MNDRYKKRYGAWAGMPNGLPPDFTRCCEEVHERDRGLFHQCHRKRGHGPDGAYCKQHDPAAVKARSDAAEAKHAETMRKMRLEWAGPRLLAALKQIADGHNAPRALASEAIRDLV